jgi:uncharacterized protein
MLVVPDAVNLPPTGGSGTATSQDFAQIIRLMLEQCAALRDHMAILDVWGTDGIVQSAPDFQQQLDACIANFQAAVGDVFALLSYGAAYSPFLDPEITQRGEIDYTGVEPMGDRDAKLRRYLTLRAAQLHAGGPAAYDKARALIQRLYPPNDPTNPKDPPIPSTKAEIAQLSQALCGALPLLQQIEDVMAERANVLPPSAAIAGLFATNDIARGVWKALANLGLNAVISPSLKLDDAQQAPLNAPPNGKAVNVIRDFVGRGPIVWGARTLDGNSQDWRYVQTRRTIIGVEQSIEAALGQFVFAPNDGRTWATMVSMISGSLTNLWQQGGLMGDKASDAFTVQCGLGSTMTSQEILEGYMIVHVTLQQIRPAEFIELTFKQKMQGVG